MQAMRKMPARYLLTRHLPTLLAVWAFAIYPGDAADVSTEAQLNTALSLGQNITITAPIMLTQEVVISSSLAIEGNCSSRCPVYVMGDHRHFTISGPGITVDIRNVSLEGGSAEQGGSSLVTDGATAVFSFVDFKNNRASGEFGAGGALLLMNGSVAFVRVCIMTNNTAPFGGAVEVADMSKITIRATTFSNNSASVAGGALNAISGGVAVLRNSIFDGNVAPIGGAANAQSATINSCASNISGNSATLGVGPNMLAGEGSTFTFCQNQTAEIVSDRGGKVSSFCEVCLPPVGRGMHPPGKGKHPRGKGKHPYNVGMHPPKPISRGRRRRR